jgi:hypothetical protein
MTAIDGVQSSFILRQDDEMTDDGVQSPDEDFRRECRGAIQIFRSVWEDEASLRKQLEIEASTDPELMQPWVFGTR